MADRSASFIAELKLKATYDATGAKGFQNDILKMQKVLLSSETALNAFFAELQKIKAAGGSFIDKDILHTGITDQLMVLKKDIDTYEAMVRKIGKESLVTDRQSRQARTYIDNLRELIDVVYELNHINDPTNRGTTEKFFDSYQKGFGDTHKFMQILAGAYTELERRHNQFYENLAAHNIALAKEQQQLAAVLGKGDGFKMSLSSLQRLRESFGDLSLSLVNVSRDYLKFQRELQLAHNKDPDALGAVEIRKNAAALVDALRLQKERLRALLADPGIGKVFDDDGIRQRLEATSKAIDLQINQLKQSLDFIPKTDFLGGDFYTNLEAIETAFRTTDRYLKDFNETAGVTAAKTDAAFAGVSASAVEAAKNIRNLPGAEGLFEATTLTAAGERFEKTIAGLVKLRATFNHLQAEFKGQSFGHLFSEDIDGFVKRSGELKGSLAGVGSMLKQLHENESLASLFPPVALEVIQRAQREVETLAATFTNVKAQSKGTFLDTGISDSAFLGAVGALKVGLSGVEDALSAASVAGGRFSVNIDHALQMLDAGRLLNSVKAFQSLAASLRGVDSGVKAAISGLPDVLEKLKLFNAKQLEQMSNPRTNFDSEEAFERYQMRFAKNFGGTLGLVKEYQDRLAVLDGQLKRFIATGEKFGIVDEADLARAREYQSILHKLAGATPVELASVDPAAFSKQSRDYQGANTDLWRETTTRIKAANTELFNHLQALRQIPEVGRLLDDGPKAAADSLRALTTTGTQTGQVIENMRDQARAAAAAIEQTETAMAGVGQAAGKAEAAARQAADGQKNLATGTRAAADAARDQARDIDTANAILRQSRAAAAQAGVQHHDLTLAARGSAGAVRETGVAADGAGDNFRHLGDTIGELEKPLRVTEVRFDELLDTLKRADSFKAINERFEESARRIIEEQRAIGQLTGTYGRFLQETIKTADGGERFERALKNVGASVLALNGDLNQSQAAMARYAQAWREISVQRTIFSRGGDLVASLIPGGSDSRIASFIGRLSDIGYRLHDWRTEMKLIKAGIAEAESSVYKALTVLGKLKHNIVEGLFHGVGYELTNAIQMAAMHIKQFIKDSQQVYADFSRGMAEVYTVIPDASGYMRDKLAADVAFISAQYGYLQNEVLPAAYQALSLGIEGPDVTAAVATAAKAARASVSELEPTFETGQSLVNAYGGELYQLVDIYDMLFYAIQNGGITMRDINNQMAPITAVAGEVGVAFADIVAAMVVMSRQGDDMGSISKMLSNMLTQIQIDSTALGEAFKEAAGTGFREFIANGGTLVEALELISDRVQETGISITETVGGDSPFFRDQQAMLAVLELTGVHLDDLKAAAEGAANAGGRLHEAYREVENTVWMVGQRSAAAGEALKRELGEAMEPITRRWMEFKLSVAGNLASGFRAGTLLEDMQLFGRYTNYATEEYERLLWYIQHQDPASGMGLFEGALQWAADNDSLNFFKALQEGYRGAEMTARSANEQMLRSRIVNVLLASDTQTTAEAMMKMAEAIAAQVEYSKQFEDPTGGASLGGMRNVINHYRDFAQEIQDIFRYEFGEELSFEVDNRQALEAMGYHFDLEAATAFVQAYVAQVRQRIGRIFAKDGDTFDVEIDGEVTAIRLNNIDTAEIATEDGGANKDFGQRALEFSQDFIADGEISLSPSYGESYERQLRNLFNEAGRSLDLELIRQGLAIPITFEVKGSQMFGEQLRRIARQAAEAGIGVFENELVRSMYLEGSIRSMGQVSQIYDHISGHFETTLDFTRQMEEAFTVLSSADGAWVEDHADNAARIVAIQARLAGDLTHEQRKALDAQLEGLDAFSADYDAIARQIDADLTENQRGDLQPIWKPCKAARGRRS